MAAMEKIDWSDCPLVEVKPGVQSGAPVLRGTRMPANAILDNFDYGLRATDAYTELAGAWCELRVVRPFSRK